MKQHEEAIEHAKNIIFTSNLSPYVEAIILFGSCSRNEEKWDSDVDLLLQLKEECAGKNNLKKEILLVKGTVSLPETFAPEVDLKIVFGNEWKKNNNLFYENIRKDGVLIYEA